MLDSPRKHCVLVLGHDVRTLLPIARSLGRNGIAVELAGCPQNSPALRSKFVTRFHPLPADVGSEEWFNATGAIVQQGDFSLVIPASEPTVFALQQRDLESQRPVRTYRLNRRAFEIASNKIHDIFVVEQNYCIHMYCERTLE